MRQITVKYTGECRKCGNTLIVGSQAMYEKTTGIFCVGCEPTDTEDIRGYRQERADRKADRYDEWAGKRETKATAAAQQLPGNPARHRIQHAAGPYPVSSSHDRR